MKKIKIIKIYENNKKIKNIVNDFLNDIKV